ncbi:MAG TPA: AbrB/MazE/SpoVT family DNA-binding domain-containing protein [Thermoanaerobaculia bacterium]|nr:AbrB/MazE/SpoVT family DNA-binding domain-containing protein [Thermoanaerobaculia bacterium]
METSGTKKGQTNIPAAIRKRYQIHDGDRLAWLDHGETIHVVPLPAEDPVAALRGSAKGKRLTEHLLVSRREDR